MIDTAEGISCETCSAACCRRYKQLQLTDDEARMITDSGGRLLQLLSTEDKEGNRKILECGLDPDSIDFMTKQLGFDEGFYQLQTDCPFIDESSESFPKCQLFGQGERFGICESFTPGSNACLIFRLVAGVDKPHESLLTINT